MKQWGLFLRALQDHSCLYTTGAYNAIGETSVSAHALILSGVMSYLLNGDMSAVQCLGTVC